MRDVEGTPEVDVDHGVDHVDGHVVERLIAKDAGVVDEDVDPPERVECRLHDRLSTFGGGHAFDVGHRLAAEGDDLVDDLLRGAGGTTRPVDQAAEVVDHEASTSSGEFERMAAAEAVAGTGDDGDFVVEAEVAHCAIPCMHGPV